MAIRLKLICPTASGANGARRRWVLKISDFDGDLELFRSDLLHGPGRPPRDLNFAITRIDIGDQGSLAEARATLERVVERNPKFDAA
jgi:hypothetical protein